MIGGITYTMEIREMKNQLDMIPDEELLAIGLPQITFYKLNGSFQALCPFHNDQHLGSFGYNPHNHTWKCFACEQSGKGVYSLMMRVLGWAFPETVKYLYEHRRDVVGKFDTHVPASLLQKGKTPSKMAAANYVPKLAQAIEMMWYKKS